MWFEEPRDAAEVALRNAYEQLKKMGAVISWHDAPAAGGGGYISIGEFWSGQPSDLKRIELIPVLRSVFLLNSPELYDNLAAISSLRFENLCIRSPIIDVKTMDEILKCSHVKQLWIEARQLPKDNLSRLNELKDLQRLVLIGGDMDETTVSSLRALKPGLDVRFYPQHTPVMDFRAPYSR